MTFIKSIDINRFAWSGIAAVATMVAIYAILTIIGPEATNRTVGLLSLPSDVSALLTRPWSILTYQLIHIDPLHLLANCLVLMAFILPAKRSGRYSPALFLIAFIAGATAGACAFMLVSAGGTSLVGCSASVMAIAALTVALCPAGRERRRMGVILLVLLCIDALLLYEVDSTAHISHLAGAASGLVIAFANNLTNHMRTRDVDKIAAVPGAVLFDKARRSGHSSLTEEERRILFNLSKK